MNDCGNCANKKSDVCGNCITAYINDERQDPSHWVLSPKTNADHIRSMTDEELAKTIIFYQQAAMQYVVEQMGCKAPPPDEIREGDYIRMLDWLKQPYKEK